MRGEGAAAAERGLADAAGSGSSRLSAPLALGLLSPRHVAATATAAAAAAATAATAEAASIHLAGVLELVPDKSHMRMQHEGGGVLCGGESWSDCAAASGL